MFTYYIYFDSITALISHAVWFGQLRLTWQVRFEDIGGLEDAKRAINEAVILPLLMPEFFVGLRSFGKFVTWGLGYEKGRSFSILGGFPGL